MKKLLGLVKKEEIKPLSNFDILKLVKDLKIKYFRGVFMKDELPKKFNKIECGIINLENSDKERSHWTAYYKNNDKKSILILTEMLIFQSHFLVI